MSVLAAIKRLFRRLFGLPEPDPIAAIAREMQRRLAQPGARPLTEGYVNKGGLNPWPSQVTKRPPPPPPSNIRKTKKRGR